MYTCFWCNKTDIIKTKDHIYPKGIYKAKKRKGKRRIVICCFKCNQDRGKVTNYLCMNKRGLHDFKLHQYEVLFYWFFMELEKLNKSPHLETYSSIMKVYNKYTPKMI